ncbi:receptor-like protein EIX2 [Papaver somniferum]|uniref:receptor-like protein EIX2 n=1 Tax=Papaver somniferum TaxID=3469 RepID=UPI000E6FE8B4|nr:receptor-like protein EIX2 [Papaver somniferum]
MNYSSKYVQIPLMFFLILSITQIPKTSYACQDDERIALLHFKTSLTDISDRLSSWKVHRHQNCCAWHGIQCSTESFQVISIDLRNIDREIYLNDISDYSQPSPNTSLSGTISSSLLSLTHLVYLDLSFNDLDYTNIQYRLPELKYLTHFDVSYSNFSGWVTTQFSNLSSLQYLDISGYVQPSDPRTPGYRTSNIPLISSSINWVKELVHLRVLRLSGVDISEATVQSNWAKPISFLHNLEELHLSACHISSPIFPINEFLNLSHLSSLHMNYNGNLRTSITNQIANLTSLSVLELSGCYNLQGSIPYLPQLKRLDIRGSNNLYVNLTSMFERQWLKLQVLWMSSTYVNGWIPSSISNAPSLVSFIASRCLIKGSLPTSITNLSRLEYLDLDFNDITGYVPPLGSNMKNLKHLSLSRNNLQGPIPDSICDIINLQQLNLFLNDLSELIPNCITGLQNLQYLDVSDNSIDGIISLHSFIDKLNLMELNLNSNKITIEIDQHSLPSKFQLERLELQSCNIKGDIPAFFCSFTNLTKLDLSQSNLMGVIPSCLFKHQTLTDLDLSQNNLQGTLPHEFQFNPNKNMYLNLAGNKLHGSVPLPSPKNWFFDLSNNQFSGGIQFEVGKRLSTSRYASLSSNQLSGTIPLSFCLKISLEMPMSIGSLNLSNNTLTGSIPSSFGNCSSLVFLHLGMNNLTGRVPNVLQHIPIGYLLLNDNSFEGSFPNFIRQLQVLQVLSLGNNKFDGNIPSFIGSFEYLRILSLRSNRFDGSIPKEINHLGRLQILDLSMNNLSGPIPRMLGNLTMLRSRLNSTSPGWSGGMFIPDLQMRIAIKGVLQPLQRLKEFSSGIDLSSNYLGGNIPEELGKLEGLSMLNLSNNLLNGKIPTSVGNMLGLESLDLSFNKLSGGIPTELTTISYLGFLNLSYNNLSGRIPQDDHFQSLGVDGFAFLGNQFLCGIPTKKHCDGDPIGPTSSNTDKNTNLNDEDEDGARETVFLFGSIILGVAVGFWGLFLVLLCKKEKWWFRYWRAVDTVVSRLTGCIRKNQ